MSEGLEPPVLPEGAPWRCPMCGESYQFVNHPFCLARALKERDNPLLRERDRLRALLAETWEWANRAMVGTPRYHAMYLRIKAAVERPDEE